MAFASFEMKLVLGNLLSNWNMELANIQPVQPSQKGALLSSGDGVKMLIKAKREKNLK
ncbi:hypothetical protein [Dolichospermum sp. UHCC 0259]|uniref:hypothetical protein n=1 Tax=Dolichospermum sp. UHCC 0259 TaxID=2590010 RepID=UPI00352BC9E8